MKRSSRLLVAALTVAATVILSGPGPALAQSFPVAQNCTAVLNTPGPLSVSMFLIPNGSGTQLANCYAFGGTSTSAVISVTLIDAAGLPVVNVPATDVRLQEISSNVFWCSNAWYPPPVHAPNLADMASNAAGQTQFSLSYHGGGWVHGSTFVWVLEASGAWMQIPTPVNVSYNSPDITGDLVVNLSDVGLFAIDFFSGYMYRSDFNYDGVVNLTDLAMLAPTLGISCP